LAFIQKRGVTFENPRCGKRSQSAGGHRFPCYCIAFRARYRGVSTTLSRIPVWNSPLCASHFPFFNRISRRPGFCKDRGGRAPQT